jgi:HD-GYP domain-containing protein (c-di-GMP phosphodiesterase class II)
MQRDVISTLRETGVDHFYVRTEEFHHFSAHLLETINEPSQHESLPAAERYAVLQHAMAVEIEKASQLVDCEAYVRVAEKLSRELTLLLTDNDVVPSDIYRLARHDFNTFTHVTNVASYAIILANCLGLGDRDDLERIAKAAILHDLGKRFIPANILTKPARLDPDERALIETHPQRGYEELCARDDFSFEELMIVYQHHERFDGAGYPVGLQGDEIHPWARMLAIVDVFDAKTGVRPYRRAATRQQTLDYICRNAGTHFDPEMAPCWRSIMATS